MQLRKLFVLAGVLAGLPALGYPQQAPGELDQATRTEDEIRRTIRAQTQAILKLHEQVAALEARVAELEKSKADKHSDPQ
jgi:BMFP domain-containing protein YqiC